MLNCNIFIVVCDTQRALIYQNTGSTESPNLTLIDGFEQKNPPARDQGSDKPGTSFAGGTGPRSSVSQTDYHEAQQHAFAKHVLNEVAALKTKKKVEKLIWVAPPRMLSMLRADMPKTLKEVTVAEIDKDLTKHSTDKIIEILNKAR